MKKNKITNKQKCTSCIHKEVCSIYEFARKCNETSLVKITPYSMADVCKKYLRDIERSS